MIVDVLSNANSYKGLSPLLDRALDALGRLTTHPPADGRHELAGSDLVAILSSYSTEEPASRPFEAHRWCIDVQVLLAGQETLYWAPLESIQPRGEYSNVDDVAFYDGPPGLAVPLEPGLFTVLFPQDAHKPGCHPGSAARVRKLVLKVGA